MAGSGMTQRTRGGFTLVELRALAIAGLVMLASLRGHARRYRLD